jgi:hypothetical protein
LVAALTKTAEWESWRKIRAKKRRRMVLLSKGEKEKQKIFKERRMWSKTWFGPGSYIS